jgi:dTDP-4-dehydrorhamnose 3,5-epimerase
MAKAMLYSREDSPTKGEINEFYLGEHKPRAGRHPPSVYHGYKNIGTELVLMLNIPTETYNYSQPDEYRVARHGGDIAYDWSRKDG